MIRKINEKARRALKKSLLLGGALLFVTAVAGCEEYDASRAGVTRAAADPGGIIGTKAEYRSFFRDHGFRDRRLDR